MRETRASYACNKIRSDHASERPNPFGFCKRRERATQELRSVRTMRETRASYAGIQIRCDDGRDASELGGIKIRSDHASASRKN